MDRTSRNRYPPTQAGRSPLCVPPVPHRAGGAGSQLPAIELAEYSAAESRQGRPAARQKKRALLVVARDLDFQPDRITFPFQAQTVTGAPASTTGFRHFIAPAGAAANRTTRADQHFRASIPTSPCGTRYPGRSSIPYTVGRLLLQHYGYQYPEPHRYSCPCEVAIIRESYKTTGSQILCIRSPDARFNSVSIGRILDSLLPCTAIE